MKSETLFIKNQTKGKLPSLPFSDMKDFMLGKNYELSLVFIGATESRKLNNKWRQKDKPTNVLSFPLSETAGEIFLTPSKAKKEAPSFDRKYDNFIAFLFIHGLAHLKGLDHGDEMEAIEAKARKKFGI